MSTSFHDGPESWRNWSECWEKLKEFKGSRIPEDQVSIRIQEVISLGKRPLPSGWMREGFNYIKATGYRRGDKERAKSEHLLEVKLFGGHLPLPIPTWPVTGLNEAVIFIPVLNAVSLANRNEKQREIDVLGILAFPNHSIPCSVEMKGATTNHAWHAVVENLQHLILLRSYPGNFLSNTPNQSPCDQFRNLLLSEAWGMVLAPSAFFRGGRNGNSFQHAKNLIKDIKQKLEVTILLACFPDEVGKPIEVLFRPDQRSMS
jgi:hypothetical protein